MEPSKTTQELTLTTNGRATPLRGLRLEFRFAKLHDESTVWPLHVLPRTRTTNKKRRPQPPLLFHPFASVGLRHLGLFAGLVEHHDAQLFQLLGLIGQGDLADGPKAAHPVVERVDGVIAG